MASHLPKLLSTWLAVQLVGNYLQMRVRARGPFSQVNGGGGGGAGGGGGRGGGRT